MKHKISAGLFAQLLNLIESEGLDSTSLCQRVGIGMPERLDSFVPRTDAYRLMALVVEVSRNEDIGLSAYRHFLPGSFQLVGYVMMSSANLRQAIELMAQFSPLLSSGITLGLSEEGDGLRLWYVEQPCSESRKPRSLEDAGLASLLGFCRWLTGNNLPKLREVEFTYAQPLDITEHQRLFACELKFGGPRVSILFDRAALQQPLSSSNAALALLHGDLARQRMEQLRVTAYSAQVRGLLLERLNLGPCDMEMVAVCMNISKRTLQRGLDREGVHFKDILDEVRQQLADYYLRHNAYNLSRVAELLGFKEPSSFHKACLRWYGMPPGRYRTQLAKELAEC